MEWILDIVNGNYLLSCFVMLAIGGSLLFAATRTKKDVLFILCILWSLICIGITYQIPVGWLNIKKDIILLAFLAAHVIVTITTIVIYLQNDSQGNSKWWEIARTFFCLLPGILLVLFLIYKAAAMAGFV